MAFSQEYIEKLAEYAWVYIQECEDATIEMATNKGIQKIKSRHIPTISYFLRIWLPRKGMDAPTRKTWYEWLKQKDEDGEPNEKSDTIKSIDDIFRALAEDIVATEGKGIFYAKNRLGMTDRQQVDTTANVNILTIDPIGD
jgi:hypothetical protein